MTTPPPTASPSGTTPITGAHALVGAMREQEIGAVFGTVGHGNLTLIDALLDAPSIRFVSAFHEQVAIHAADAYYRVSGRVAVVTTTVGPGATNLTTGLGDALLDCSATVVITGGVPTAYAAKDALQALSPQTDDSQWEIFRPLTKRVIRVTRVQDLVPQFHRALQEAQQGRPGPVLLHVPLDVLAEPVAPPAPQPRRTAFRPFPDPQRVAEAARLLEQADRPVLYCGGGAHTGRAPEMLRRLAERLQVPVATSMSGQGAFPEDHPLSVGTTGVVGTLPGNTAIAEADLVIAVGTQFPEMDANSWRPDFFASIPPTRLVHVDVEPAVLNRVYPANVAICADAGETLAALDAATAESTRDARRGWRQRVSELRESWADSLRATSSDARMPFEPGHVLAQLRSVLPAEGVLVSGVGVRHAVAQHFPVSRPRSLVVASGFGTMGQEVAAPLGVTAAVPEATSVAVVGDGAVLACLAAIPTAVAAGLPVRWVVLDNGGYASIAVYQNKHFGRLNGTRFLTAEGKDYTVDYVGLAHSFGAWGAQVGSADELQPMLREMLAQPGPALLSVPVTPTPRIQGSGHWDVNDILASGARVARTARGETGDG